MVQKYFPLLLFLLIGTGLCAGAQQFGGFPPSTQWKQINTDTARIIFTPGAAAEAQRIATIIHTIAADTPNALGNRIRKINVVLHSATTQANGYVSLAPFRSEFYLIPGSDLFEFGNLPWHELLATHEYRHVQQFNNYNHGITKLFYYVAGEEGTALANALTIPNWFDEGDAVHQETALTGGGRGRLPHFLNAYKSLWHEGKHYNWMKLRNGSLKDYVPNHYDLGYLLVNYGYLQYGADFWQKVTRDAAAFRGLVYPFQQAVKRYTGLNYKTFTRKALDFYKQQVPLQKEPPKRENVLYYYFPQFTGTGSIIYLKSGYDRIPAFYSKDAQGEHKIKRKYISSEDWFSYRSGKIVYTAYNPDARWSFTDYSDIVLLDAETKREEWITKKGKYFTPDISPDGRTIVAVSVNDSLQSDLQLIRISNKKIINSIKAPKGALYSNPKFMDNDHIIAGLRLPDATLTLQKINIATAAVETIIPPTTVTIGFPAVQGDTVFFTASFAGNDDLYAVRLSDKKMYQLTEGIAGNYFPSVRGDSILWSAFTAEGYRLRKEAIHQLKWSEVDSMQKSGAAAVYPVANAGNIVLPLATRHFGVSTYRKSHGLIHFHSWQPDYTPPDYSISLLSNNILNTIATEAYYNYNENELSNRAGLNVAYAGWFPVLTAGGEYAYHRHINTANRHVVLNQYEIRLGYNIPLNFSKGMTYKFMNVGSEYVYNRLLPAAAYKNTVPAQTVNYLHHFLMWQQQLPRAVQQIYPTLGYAASLHYRQRLQKVGYQVLSSAALILPSVFKNHSLVLTGSWQQTDTANVVFTNNFAHARGYTGSYFSKMWRASANYHFPILYPDKGFGNIVYVLRLRGNIFYDYSKLYSKTRLKTALQRSTGAEIYFDTKWWNELPVSFGVRYSYLLDQDLSGSTNPHRIEIILPVNLIPN